MATTAAGPPPQRLGEAQLLGWHLVWDCAAFGVAPDLEDLLALTDPRAAVETVHWGRNYLWRARVNSAAGERDVVVKQFRHDSARSRWRRQHEGSKARKSWQMAWHLLAAGLATPTPLLLAESLDPAGPAVFVCARLDGVEEIRYRFRRWNAGAETDPPAAVVLAATAHFARQLHDAGVWHRDFSAGNILVGEAPVVSSAAPPLWLVDLNRSRLRSPVSLAQRMRDLARLPAHRREHRQLLRAAYFEPGPVPRFAALLHELAHRNFHGRHQLKQKIRGGVRGRGLLGLLRPRSTYPHLAAPPAGATTRDRAVWDPLSDQPHHHATPLQKLGVRLADVGDHTRTIGSALWHLPRVVRQTRTLLANPPCVHFDGFGVAVRPHDNPEDLLEALAGLACRHVLLRVHPWEDDHDAEVELAAAVAASGSSLLVALPQNRELVRDRGRWRAKVEELAERLGPYASAFQLGQAINRSKWGVWTLGEYLDLAADAATILLARCPGAQICGPGVIDFEPHLAIAAVNRKHEGLHFDALASLLYVDRRGAPEATQLGYDTAGKAAFVRAIAQTSRSCALASWITEVNWPLREGPYSPAGRSVSVDEETQANYLARYFLLAQPFAERIYWWQLVAKGYGLCEPLPGGGLRRRASYHALATLVRQSAGAQRLATLVEGAARGVVWRHPNGTEVVAGWSTAGPATLPLPRPAVNLVSRDGADPGGGGAASLEVGAAVVYAVLS